MILIPETKNQSQSWIEILYSSFLTTMACFSLGTSLPIFNNCDPWLQKQTLEWQQFSFLFLWCDGEKDAEARVGNVEGGRRTRKLDWRQWCERERERKRERERERSGEEVELRWGLCREAVPGFIAVSCPVRSLQCNPRSFRILLFYWVVNDFRFPRCVRQGS